MHLYLERLIQLFSVPSVALQCLFLLFPTHIPNTFFLSMFTAFCGTGIIVLNQFLYPATCSPLFIMSAHICHTVPLALHFYFGYNNVWYAYYVFFAIVMYIIVMTPNKIICIYSDMQAFLEKRKECNEQSRLRR
jgi:hypothetical protein